MYCIKCGVELADSEKRCPLCDTRVYHPDLETGTAPPFYPPNDPTVKRMNRRAILFLIALFSLILVVQLFVFDLRFTGGVGWSYYASGAVILVYVCAVLPIWFRRPNPVVFVPVSFGTVMVYLIGICHMTGGNWFYTFALPVLLGAAIITTAVLVLVRYVRGGYFYISGGAVLATGAYTFLLEKMICYTFSTHFYFWSLYTMIGLGLLGVALLVCGIVAPFRSYLAKKFFL